MENQVFRQKSLDQISSTEELRDYMHVTSPKLWMVLSVVLVLVIGFIVYASAVTMENTIQVKAAVSIEKEDDGSEEMSIILTIPDSYQSVVKTDMEVRIGNDTGYVYSVYLFEDETDAVVVLDDENRVLPQGIYDAEIVIETISPISFLFN